MKHRIVVALGGNALGDDPITQRNRLAVGAESLATLIADGYDVVLTHGNGPQVGAIRLAFSEGAKKNDRIPEMPLAECTAMSQGYIGYHLQSALSKSLYARGIRKPVVSLITEVEVDPADRAFAEPTKPIGAFYTEEEAKAWMRKEPDAVFREDAGRGYRRTVASPFPLSIVQKTTVKELVETGNVVVACGGGGIPVIRRGGGVFQSVEAVIDKDFAAERLAEDVDADTLMILTDVDRVSIRYGTPAEESFDAMTVSEAEEYCRRGEFGAGSMLPKVQAAIRFAKSADGRRSVIASLSQAADALHGKAGTEIAASPVHV